MNGRVSVPPEYEEWRCSLFAFPAEEHRARRRMEKFVRDLTEHFLEVVWAFFLVALLLFGLAISFGRIVGYAATFWICLCFMLVVAAIFAAIVLGSLLCIGAAAGYRRLTNRSKKKQRLYFP